MSTVKKINPKAISSKTVIKALKSYMGHRLLGLNDRNHEDRIRAQTLNEIIKVLIAFENGTKGDSQ